MASNTDPIFPKTAILKALSLAAVSACATRAPTATAGLAAANIFELLGTGTEQRRVDWIKAVAAANVLTGATVANLVQIWIWDGTTATLYDEIDISAQPASATAKGFQKKTNYTDLWLPPTHKLFASVTQATTTSTNAITLTLGGGEC